MARNSGLLSKLPALAFAGSLLGMSYGYGLVSFKYDLFPVPVLKRAKMGYEALTKLDEPDEIFGQLEVLASEPEQIIEWLDEPRDIDDLIIVTGGLEQRPDLCPEFGCLAWIMDRDGNVYHTWSVDRDTIFSDDQFAGFEGFPTAENIFVIGADMASNGDLVVNFQWRNAFPYQLGVMRIDKDSNILWSYANNAHHWPRVAENGDVFLPWAQLQRPPAEHIGDSAIDTDCPADRAVYDEGFMVLAPDGTAKRQVNFGELLSANGLMGLAYSVRDGCDPYHINGLAELNAVAASRIENAEAGDIVISLRSSSSLIVVDRTDDVVHRVLAGPMVAQHSPDLLPDGRIAIFDNLGGKRAQGGSRVLALDVRTGLGQTLYPRPGDAQNRLLSDEQGLVRFSPDGRRALVSESKSGDVIEIDASSGKPLWHYRHVTSLQAYNDVRGLPYSGEYAVLQTHGADYVGRRLVATVFGRTGPIGQLKPGS